MCSIARFVRLGETRVNSRVRRSDVSGRTSTMNRRLVLS